MTCCLAVMPQEPGVGIKSGAVQHSERSGGTGPEMSKMSAVRTAYAVLTCILYTNC